MLNNCSQNFDDLLTQAKLDFNNVFWKIVDCYYYQEGDEIDNVQVRCSNRINSGLKRFEDQHNHIFETYFVSYKVIL